MTKKRHYGSSLESLLAEDGILEEAHVEATKNVIDIDKQNKHSRIARRMEDLDEETLNAIATAEVPAQHDYLDKIDTSG